MYIDIGKPNPADDVTLGVQIIPTFVFKVDIEITNFSDKDITISNFLLDDGGFEDKCFIRKDDDFIRVAQCLDNYEQISNTDYYSGGIQTITPKKIDNLIHPGTRIKSQDSIKGSMIIHFSGLDFYNRIKNEDVIKLTAIALDKNVDLFLNVPISNLNPFKIISDGKIKGNKS